MKRFIPHYVLTPDGKHRAWSHIDENVALLTPPCGTSAQAFEVISAMFKRLVRARADRPSKPPPKPVPLPRGN